MGVPMAFPLPREHVGEGRTAAGPTHATSRAPTRTDESIGAAIRSFRRDAGMTQRDLARRVGVTPPQMHRYEAGAARLPAGRLVQIAEALNVRGTALLGTRDEALEPELEGLVKAWGAIADPLQRRALLQLARSMAQQGAV